MVQYQEASQTSQTSHRVTGAPAAWVLGRTRKSKAAWRGLNWPIAGTWEQGTSPRETKHNFTLDF